MDNLSNVYARNCSVRRIDKISADAFLSRYHRLGTTGGRYRYGLFVNRTTGAGEKQLPAGTLVAVSVFSNARRWNKGDVKVSSYEWIRYASPDGIRVVGGMSRMLKTFIGDVNPDDVMSYADENYPDHGMVYQQLGFVKESVVEKDGYRNVKYRLKLTHW